MICDPWLLDSLRSRTIHITALQGSNVLALRLIYGSACSRVTTALWRSCVYVCVHVKCDLLVHKKCIKKQFYSSPVYNIFPYSTNIFNTKIFKILRCTIFSPYNLRLGNLHWPYVVGIHITVRLQHFIHKVFVSWIFFLQWLQNSSVVKHTPLTIVVSEDKL